MRQELAIVPQNQARARGLASESVRASNRYSGRAHNATPVYVLARSSIETRLTPAPVSGNTTSALSLPVNLTRRQALRSSSSNTQGSVSGEMSRKLRFTMRAERAARSAARMKSAGVRTSSDIGNPALSASDDIGLP